VCVRVIAEPISSNRLVGRYIRSPRLVHGVAEFRARVMVRVYVRACMCVRACTSGKDGE